MNKQILSSFYPDIIKYMRERNLRRMEQNTIVMFSDISGFTVLSEKHMKDQISGAEKIRDIINDHFKEYITIIYSNKGDILQFSGDAILSIHPTIDSAVKSAEKIIKTTLQKGIVKVKCGIGCGNVKVEVFNEDYTLYLFYGKGIKEAMESEKNCKPMEIKLRCQNAPSNKPFFPSNISPFLPPPPPPPQIMSIIEEETLKYGKFSFVSSAFILLNHNEIKTLKEILLKTPDYIHINKIEQYPEGIRMFAVCGTPIPVKNPQSLMISYILSLPIHKIKCGIANGYVFNGFIGNKRRYEFTILGKTINRTARISCISSNEILCDRQFLISVPNLSFHGKGEVHLKGIGKVKLYAIEGTYQKIPLPQILWNHEYFTEKLKKLIKTRNKIIIGETGSGRTSLLSNVIYNENHRYFKFYTGNIKGMPAVQQILNIEIEEESINNLKERVKEKLINMEEEFIIFDNIENVDSLSKEILYSINLPSKKL